MFVPGTRVSSEYLLSDECKELGFASGFFFTHSDWLAIVAPLSPPIRRKTRTNCDLLLLFPGAWHHLHIFASNFDWLVALITFGFCSTNCSVSCVIH